MNWKEVKTIAFVGASSNHQRDSYQVMNYFRKNGFTVIPINPNHEMVDDLKCYPSLNSLPEDLAKKIDMIDVFRKSKAVLPIALEAIQLRKRYGNVKIFWMQLEVSNSEAEKILSDNKFLVFSNTCAMANHKMRN